MPENDFDMTPSEREALAEMEEQRETAILRRHRIAGSVLCFLGLQAIVGVIAWLSHGVAGLVSGGIIVTGLTGIIVGADYLGWW